MNKIDPRLGNRLHQIRQHRKTSQGRLAKALGVSVGTIQNYEHGRVHITAGRLEQLAMALQCEPADLLESPDTPPPRYRRYRIFQQRASSSWYKLQPVLDLDDEDQRWLASVQRLNDEDGDED
jgi:transcriptional regulator with XRE-family HTH domain